MLSDAVLRLQRRDFHAAPAVQVVAVMSGWSCCASNDPGLPIPRLSPARAANLLANGPDSGHHRRLQPRRKLTSNVRWGAGLRFVCVLRVCKLSSSTRVAKFSFTGSVRAGVTPVGRQSRFRDKYGSQDCCRRTLSS
jgi:hypothetical protein